MTFYPEGSGGRGDSLKDYESSQREGDEEGGSVEKLQSIIRDGGDCPKKGLNQHYVDCMNPCSSSLE